MQRLSMPYKMLRRFYKKANFTRKIFIIISTFFIPYKYFYIPAYSSII